MTFPDPHAGSRGRVAQRRREQESRIADLLAIGGLAASTDEAARRIGVDPTAIRRYKRILRSRGHRG
jgi:hypothetical protein